MNIIDTDVLIGRNLKRIREKHGLSQAQLAELIGTTPQRLSAYETGRDGMGKAYMERVCRALKVQSWEFYWTEDAPIIKDEYERAALDRFRREQAAGVAEDSAKYGEYLIERAKSSTSDIDARVRRGQEILKKGRQKKSA
jgi:transcriptional regulator with XRE-family HTH domain